ncbi:MAG: GNAT family N-acetyltransferase [Gordonia sp. (in: high G+C Gram-positive bacteria)]|uniref:GNAT family N-acetyltransferase n=1 Tax=Gordonia sp. (in: high G+C Gram-positive bacteria) TaxID=84139 RepID=UPI0039E3D7EB
MPIVPIDDTNRVDAHRVFARAFHDDPLIRWLVANPKRDEAMWRFSDVHRSPGASSLYLDDDGRAVGAAWWDPPGYRPAVNRASLTFHAIVTLRSRMMRGATIEEVFPRYRPREPHWYLSTLGAVEQGRGIGSALLRHRLDQIEGPAYLESSNRVNIPLYEKFGFTVVDEVTLPKNGPTVWPMLRPAQ